MLFIQCCLLLLRRCLFAYGHVSSGRQHNEGRVARNSGGGKCTKGPAARCEMRGSTGGVWASKRSRRPCRDTSGLYSARRASIDWYSPAKLPCTPTQTQCTSERQHSKIPDKTTNNAKGLWRQAAHKPDGQQNVANVHYQVNRGKPTILYIMSTTICG